MESLENNRGKKRVRFNEEVTNIVYSEPAEDDEKGNISFPSPSVVFSGNSFSPGILLNKADENGLNEFDENTSPLVFKLINRKAPKSPGKPLKFRQIVTEELQELANKKLFISDEENHPSSSIDSTSTSSS